METKQKKKLFKGERTASTIIIVIGLICFITCVALNLIKAMTVILATLTVMATYEVVKAVGNKNKIVYAVACAVSFFSVIAVGFNIALPSVGVLYSFYAMILMSLTVFFNKSVKFIHVSTAFFASVSLPYAFSCFLKLNDIYSLNPAYTHYEGIYFVALGFACSWLTDSFAYLVGRKFGKHKMCPVISPKKSIEGAVGGVLITALLNVVILFAFNIIGEHFWQYTIFGQSNMKYLAIIPVSIVLSLVSMLGDLVFSVIKRNFGIKDFSQILPGHGGIMDRFDSCTFVLPTLYGIVALFMI